MRKEHYFEQLKKIKMSYLEYWRPGVDPYMIYHWITILTPIEYNVWSDIRYLGLPFYPQFPVRGYFLDFADPINKIGIEVDGKEWHLDKEKDLKRQNNLEEIGWKIIRIEGKYTYANKQDFFKDIDEEYYDSKKHQFETLYSEGILGKLREKYDSGEYEVYKEKYDVEIITMKDILERISSRRADEDREEIIKKYF